MENKFSTAPTNHNINVAINRCQDQLDLYTKKVSLERVTAAAELPRLHSGAHVHAH